ncbi:MAG: HAD family phosphatase [Eubacteriales bacterium]|nr:HAD family phosphatase [Eubacteriales bacterium]
MIKAVIFDQDGLMFDTERISGEAWRQAEKGFGIHVDDAFLNTIRGMNAADAKQRFCQAFGEQLDFEALRSRKRRIFEELLLQEGIPVKPGLYELLDYLKENGYPAAVASASSHSYTERNLRSTGIDGYFCCMVTGDMVERAKPDPAIFLQAARLLGKQPEECLVLEDSINGVEAGLRGGFVTVMVPDIARPDERLRRRVKRVCSSLLEVKELLEAGELD